MFNMKIRAAATSLAAAVAVAISLRTAAAGLPDDDRGLLPAIVVADRSGVRQPVLDDFRRSGMAYLMAVGGLHLMVVCGSVLWLLRRISLGAAWCLDLTANLAGDRGDALGPMLRALTTVMRAQGLIPVTIERFS